MAQPSWLRYANAGATRNQPLNPRLAEALRFLDEMGITAEVFSGGQPSSGSNRVGSHRHDHGNSGDVNFYKDGRRLSWANEADRPIFEEIVKRGKAAGITGFGAGPGYMGEGSMHIGYGTPSVWGAGGRSANAPDWLRNAYYNGTVNPSAPEELVPNTKPNVNVAAAPPTAPGTPAPPLNEPHYVRDHNIGLPQSVADGTAIAKAPTDAPQGLLALLKGGAEKAADNPLLSALGGMEQQQPPQMLQPPPMQPSQQALPPLNQYIAEFIASRLRKGGTPGIA